MKHSLFIAKTKECKCQKLQQFFFKGLSEMKTLRNVTTILHKKSWSSQTFIKCQYHSQSFHFSFAFLGKTSWSFTFTSSSARKPCFCGLFQSCDCSSNSSLLPSTPHQKQRPFRSTVRKHRRSTYVSERYVVGFFRFVVQQQPHRSQWSKKTSKGHMVRIKARLFILFISCLLHDTHLMAQLMPVACDCLSVVSLYSDRKHVMSTSQVSYTLFTYTVGLILYYLFSWYIRYCFLLNIVV